MFNKENVNQNMFSGDNCVLVQAGRDVNLIIKRRPPDIRLVKLSIEEFIECSLTRQKITVILKNNGDTTAVLLKGMIKSNGQQTIKDCSHMNSAFSLVESDWVYDVDITEESPQFAGKHAIAPNEVVSFDVMVGRKQGGHELTVYRCYLLLEFDEGEPLETDIFYFGISGPTEIAGSYTHKGPTKEQWGKCWADNIRRLDALGYDARWIIHPESAPIIENVAPGLMERKAD
ncbi:hypothetical protein [Azospirillum argentinense]|uniref:hypothetical protein n=2 Tax=Azospirillum argentinense TaxID=2970906 RepID=UPI00118713EA|nr:hypothetical protein [Azospirillum argentinense]